ncbi:MAG: SUMF1/EgtB/PvdO family nonheme iron enzyme [Deltaproteobacteria bacterium]|nr:SUMF1/EgtB/PvdO family nonheme iron enzyme [Deltaproteobacteria bacterium]
MLSASAGDDEIAWYENRNVADPLDPDSDNDGRLDGDEVAFGSDPLDTWSFEVVIDFAEVANPANPPEGTGFGAVANVYRFIRRTGDPGSYHYTVFASRDARPINFVSLYDAMRFANWLHNGQPTGPQDVTTTEDGAYTITAEGVVANVIVRNAGARHSLPTEDEWYKAAYFDPVTGGYFDSPAGSANPILCIASIVFLTRPTAKTCGRSRLTSVPTPLAWSPYGTFDQAETSQSGRSRSRERIGACAAARTRVPRPPEAAGSGTAAGSIRRDARRGDPDRPRSRARRSGSRWVPGCYSLCAGRDMDRGFRRDPVAA